MAEATEDPDSAANPAHARTVAEASPPRRCPSQAYAAAKRSALMPETAAKFPISTNSGMTLSAWTAAYENG